MTTSMVVIPRKLEAAAEFVGFTSDEAIFGPVSLLDRVSGMGGVPSGLKAGQWKFEFPAHQVTVSVVRHRSSYGRAQGLFEMAVIDFVTGMLLEDVEGYLTEDAVVERLGEIRAYGHRVD